MNELSEVFPDYAQLCGCNQYDILTGKKQENSNPKEKQNYIKNYIPHCSIEKAHFKFYSFLRVHIPVRLPYKSIVH